MLTYHGHLQLVGYGGVKRPCLLYHYPHGLWCRVVFKQICQGVGMLINRNFEEARLSVAFCHEFKHFV